MSKIHNFYPPEYNPHLDSGLRRNDMVAVLNKLEDPNLPEDIWSIVSAYLLNPLTNGELESIRGPRAIEALNGEVAFLDTITTKTAEDYIAKYKTYGVLAQFTLADLGRRVYGVYRLYITDLARLNEYQIAFPTVRHLVLRGVQIPDGQRISAKQLEHLDLFRVQSPKIPVADFLPPIQRVLMSRNDRYAGFIVEIALEHIAKLKLHKNLKIEMSHIVRSTPKENYLMLLDYDSDSDRPYLEEWELNTALHYRAHFDFNPFTYLSDSIYAPYSKIRDLFLYVFLPQIPLGVQTLIGDYLVEAYDPLKHYYEDIRKYQGIEDASAVLKRRIRQNESEDPRWKSEPASIAYSYEQVFETTQGFEDFYEKVSQFSAKELIAES